MPTLFLLRHAKAAKGLAVADYDRPLLPVGMAQAVALGRWWQGQPHWYPDAIHCSAAARTRETAQAVQEGAPALAAVPVTFWDALYNGHAAGCTPARLQAFVRDLSPTTQNALLIGHNPDWHETAVHYANTATGPELLAGFPPGSLAVLQAAVPWADWRAGVADLCLFRPGTR